MRENYNCAPMFQNKQGELSSAVRFGDYELDPKRSVLSRNGIALKLQPQPFRVLELLLARAPEIVTRDEIGEYVWEKGVYVDLDQSLNFCIRQIRYVLNDSAASPRFVETLPKQGYRFIEPVVEVGGLRAAENGFPDVQDGVSAETDNHGHQSSVEGNRRSRNRILAGIGVTLIAVLVTGFLLHRAVSNRVSASVQTRFSKPTSSRMRVVQLTNLPGVYRRPAFSPNGEQIAFVWDGENPVRGDLYVQLIGGDRPLRLTHTRSGFVCCADWSPDGRQIAFGRCDDNGGGVFIVPALGGPERKVTDVDCPYGTAGHPQWTADGLSLVLADRCVPDGRVGIVVFSLQTGERRCLHTPPSGDSGDVAPMLSPDQQTVAFLSRPTVGLAHLYAVSLSGKNLRQLTFDDGDGDFASQMWSADGKYIVFNVTGRGLVRVPAIGGALERETVYPYSGALSPDGRRLAHVEPDGGWPFWAVVWRAELSRAGGRVVSQEKILASTAENDGPQLSPDEQQIVFQSDRSGPLQIWKSAVNGSAPMQMTFLDEGYPGTPRWSPDGKWIVFDYHTLKHHSQIYMIDSEGRNLHAVTSGDYENSVPSYSRDGMAIYFASNRTGDWQVWRRELSTGQETQVTRHGGFAAFESYDAKTLYYSRLEGGGIWSMPRGGGEEQHITAALHRGYWGHFAVTDSGIYYVDSDAEPGPAVMYYNFQTRRFTPVLTLKQNPVPWTAANLAASRDGRVVFYVQAEFRNSTITMAENF
jgi:Tol biopolymer transport system component/DNA-binding winged helix-turn-helix (wHTH) protein